MSTEIVGRDVRFVLQLGQISSKSVSENEQKLVLKSPRFVLFGANWSNGGSNMTSMIFGEWLNDELAIATINRPQSFVVTLAQIDK